MAHDGFDLFDFDAITSLPRMRVERKTTMRELYDFIGTNLVRSFFHLQKLFSAYQKVNFDFGFLKTLDIHTISLITLIVPSVP